jgi:hypothetical protein
LSRELGHGQAFRMGRENVEDAKSTLERQRPGGARAVFLVQRHANTVAAALSKLTRDSCALTHE